MTTSLPFDMPHIEMVDTDYEAKETKDSMDEA